MKKTFKLFLLFLLLGLTYIVYTNYKKLNIISGFSAKMIASQVFVANRVQESVEQSENNFSPINSAKNIIDFKNKTVTSSFFGMKKRKAIYREGLGAVLVNKEYDENTPYLVPKRNKTPKNLPFPYGELPQNDTVFLNIDYNKLNKVVDNYFDKNNHQSTTNSLLIIYKNQIIAEKYADGFDKDTRILGWSMGKSLVSTVYGVMEQQGKVDRNEKAPIDTWKNDERSKITINNLLQMNSGLEWVEDYTKISDITKMLYLETDMAKSQIDKPLIGKPNESWNYSSGTSNLLSGILRQKFNSHQEYLDFWYTDFIDKIGMHSMIIETDLAGNYVASSYPWATTRDWAKYGLLYLNKGNWNGEQIINEDWIKYTVTPTNGSEGVYGAQFWLNAGGHLLDVPKDMFMADGYQGQRVMIIPSKDLVVVRFGVNYSQIDKLLAQRPVKANEKKEVVEFELGNIEYNNLLKDILETI
ncbi:serine hydrolase domain-containing protein [Urechidicola croceus]|uniref:Serine hydrolase n=1 Tax=Urechidicola croceus TaxID=1850246 RepID=A0A1D8PA15_9FLAO|nr:serine hydrolase [Urechidicola croceus]AOW21341.1 serine hydrolase [Urechidicola croceus]